MTSVSQCTWRYVRLQAMPTTPRLAIAHHHLRRQALRDGERDEGEPATSAKEEQSDEGERKGTAEPAPEPVEDEREMGEQRRLEVMHCFGPAAVHAEGSFWYEDGDQDDEREHCAGCPKRMNRMREKRLT